MPRKPRDRWYSLDSQAKSRSIAYEKSTGTRRLVSLAMLLALVVILIQRASDVKQIEKVGRAVGLFPASANPQDATGSQRLDSSELSTSGEAVTSDGIPSEEREGKPGNEQVVVFEALRLKSADQLPQARMEMWSELLKPASDETIEGLAAKHFRNEIQGSNADGEPTSSQTLTDSERAWRDESRETIQTWLRLSASAEGPQSDPWRAAYRELDSSLGRNEEQRIDSRDFRLALDQRLLAEFQDNSVWRPSEQLVLLRTARRVRELAALVRKEAWLWNDVPAIQSSQLMSSFSESIRGVPIQLRGTIGKLDDREGKVERAGWDVFEYDVLWMKPDDASSQPIAVFQPKQPDTSNREWKVGETVEVIGMYCKRFAYQSQRGSEIAPAVIAAELRLASEPVGAPLGAYGRWLRSLPSVRVWQPPKDVEAPYMAILSAVTPSLQIASRSGVPAKGPIPDEVGALLVESQRLQSLLDTLLASHSPWRVTEDVEIAVRSGIAVSAERIELASIPKEGVESASGLGALLRSDLKYVYRLRVEPFPIQPVSPSVEQDNAPVQSPFDVFCNQIPSEWQVAFEGNIATLRQPISLHGFSQSRKSDEGSSVAWCVADHVLWRLPKSRLADLESVNAAWLPPLSPPLKFLLEQGWSLEQKQTISSLQRPPRALSPSELPALYSLLKLQSLENEKSLYQYLGREELSSLLRTALRNRNELGDSTCLQPVHTSGRIVRISKIDVDSESQREMLGQDHYFQLDCMVDIGNITYEIPTDRDPIVYRHEYPATGLVLELPDWLEQAKSPDRAGTIGDELADTSISFPRFRFASNGWLYRFWSYKTEEMSGSLGPQHRQVVPLLVLNDLNTAPEKVKSSSAMSPSSNLGWLIPLLAVAAIWFYVRRYSKSQSGSRRLKP
ncbi:hypothetical protein SH501x_002359 [Pirellulaceae bacterium SH501]